VPAFIALNTQAASAAETLRGKALRTLGDLPPFSATLNRLIASLAGENVSFAKLGDMIEKDTVVAGNLLQLVNSARYARRGTINSVRHALAILGIDKVRNTVLGMSLTRMWTKSGVPASWSMARFNQHSAAAALLSDQIAQRVAVYYPEGAFVSGLLHDVGRLLIAMALTTQHEEIEELRQMTGASRISCEMDVLGFTHPMLSADALAAWNIPEPIRIAALYHHDSAADDTPGVSLSRVVEAANNYVNSMGVVIAESDRANLKSLDGLGLDEEARATLLDEFHAEFEVMAPFFH
jgi:HD-like signal output (HDOD) protein